MIKEKLRYNKIKKFLEDLNTREKQYIIKKLQEQIIENDVDNVSMTIYIQGKKII